MRRAEAMACPGTGSCPVWPERRGHGRNGSGGDEPGRAAWGQEEGGLENQAKEFGLHPICKGKTFEVF